MFRRVGSLPLILPVVSLCAGLLSGCSAPPQKERDQADSAIAAARAADADVYAPKELQSAVTSLAEYDRAVSNGDYRLALSHAISARDSAYAATKLAGETKTAARGEAERLIVDFEGLIIVAKSRVSGNSPLAPAVLKRTRATLNSAPKLLQEARSRLASQDFRGVVQLLQQPVQTLRKDLPPAGGRRGK